MPQVPPETPDDVVRRRLQRLRAVSDIWVREEALNRGRTEEEPVGSQLLVRRKGRPTGGALESDQS